jgi:hypothetical protein
VDHRKSESDSQISFGSTHYQVTVWCGISANGIIRPCFFEDDNRNAATVNVERYQEVAKNFLSPAIEVRNLKDA